MTTTETKNSPDSPSLLERALGEPVMGFFAILALVLAVAPFAFPLSPQVDSGLEVVEWAIVALFAVEYVVHLLAAEDRRAYVLSAWRLIDLVIVLGPLATAFAPGLAQLRATPALRIVRAVLFSARLGGIVVKGPRRAEPRSDRPPIQISVVRGDTAPQPASWEEVVRGLVSPPADEWYHVARIDRTQLGEIARDTGVSPSFLQSLGETAYPRVEVYDRFSVLFVWVPGLGAGDDAVIERKGVLLLATELGLLTVSKQSIDLPGEVDRTLDAIEIPSAPFATRTSLALLKFVLRRYEEVAGHLENHARQLELVPFRDSRPEFLERTFRIQRQVSALKSDLWRLKGILEAITQGRLPFHGLAAAIAPTADGSRAASEYLRVLTDEASYVYETAFNAREGLLALIDLHLNVVSFEMNKVMRVLAVVSALGLIPTVVGGLLGMNLSGNPWPITLAQVSFGVSTAMGLLLYVFLVKGWLR